MDEEVFELIKDFVKKNWDNGGLELDRSTSLEDDLGITGTDAVNFMDKFQGEFGIEFPSEFDYSKHFGDEGLDILGIIKGLFISTQTEKLLPITLSDLEQSVIAKKMDLQIPYNKIGVAANISITFDS